MQDRATVILNLSKRRQSYDLDIPLDITAKELLCGLNAAYDLGLDLDNPQNQYVKLENPIALLHGNNTLRQHGVMNGTIINIAQ